MTNRQLTRRTQFPLATSLFDDFFGTDLMAQDLSPLFGSDEGARANVIETETGYTVEVEAPGLTKDDFRIEINDLGRGESRMTISSHVEKKKEAQGRREFYRRSFQRSFILPQTVRQDAITASYEAGVLKVDVPAEKPTERRNEPRVIDIA